MGQFTKLFCMKIWNTVTILVTWQIFKACLSQGAFKFNIGILVSLFFLFGIFVSFNICRCGIIYAAKKWFFVERPDNKNRKSKANFKVSIKERKKGPHMERVVTKGNMMKHYYKAKIC